MEKKLYIVGGWCRDTLLAKDPKDKDYVAVGYEVYDFAHLKQIGASFPVFIDEEGNEIALARKEKSTGPGHMDFKLDFSPETTLEDDLYRRDLTINSIAYDVEEESFIDPYNGLEDLKKKKLRHTSDHFVEDPVRVLRLARMKARLGDDWAIAPETKQLVISMKHLALKSLNPERIWREVTKAIDDKVLDKFFYVLYELRVLDTIFPEIHELIFCREGKKYHAEPNVFEHTMAVIRGISEENPSYLAALAALFHDIAKPYSYTIYGNGSCHDDYKVFKNMIPSWVPKVFANQIAKIIEDHQKIFKLYEMRPKKVANFMMRYNKDLATLDTLLDLAKADTEGREVLDGYAPKDYPDKQAVLRLYDAVVSVKLPPDLVGGDPVDIIEKMLELRINEVIKFKNKE